MRSWLAVVFMALVASAAAGVARHAPRHECAHNHVMGDRVPPRGPTGEDSSASPLKLTHQQHRGATAQAVSTWHSIRFTFNYSLVENPTNDVSLLQRDRLSCTAVNQTVAIGEVNANSPNCLDPVTSQPKYVLNCVLLCRQEDIMTAQLIASLKATVTDVQNFLTNALQVVDTDNNTITVESSAMLNCGEISLPRTTQPTDVIVMVTARPLWHLGRTLAFASPCLRHPTTDRPILAHMNVAPDTVRTNTDMFVVIQHELTHAMGFTPALFPFYRHPDDVSKKYYAYNPTLFPTGPVKGDGVVTDGLGNFSIDYRQLGPGKVLKFIGPTVVAAGRSFHGCPSLDGVELENGGASQAATATHWEKRTLFFETMTATQNVQRGQYSVFSLSMFTDMGWYKANLSGADPMQWGKNMGCAWATGNCGTAWNANYLCMSSNSPLCSYDRTFTGYCNMVNYSSGDLAPAYRHFASDPFLGGSDLYPDACPMVISYVEGNGAGACSNPGNVPTDNFAAATPGSSARCFMAATTPNDRQKPSVSPTCYTMACTSGSAAVMKIGSGFYPCLDDQVFQLTYPPRFTKSPKQPDVDGVTSIISFDRVGLVQCGPNISTMCGQSAAVGLYMTTTDSGVAPGSTAAGAQRYTEWATISGISPSAGAVLGGTWVTITGTGLQFCSGVRIGGVFATNITKVSGTTLTATTAGVPAKSDLGGSSDDGLGTVDVELWCNLTQLCPGGCHVGRLTQAFTLQRGSSSDSLGSGLGLSASSLTDFLGTTVGKIVGGVVGVVLLIIFLFAAKSCLCSDNTPKVHVTGGKGARRRGVGNEYQDEML